MRISQIVARHLGHYVYTLSDPETKEVFYVGKGKGGRCLQHSDDGDGAKAKKLKELKKRGKEPRIDILVHGLESEEMAFRVEAAAIDLIGKNKLVNEVRGWGSREYGKAELSKLIAMYQKSPVKITDPVMLIRISQRFRYDMTPVELYDATRGIWVLGKRRENARFALAVFEGVIQEVYEIKAWFEAGETFSTREENLGGSDRWEFVGQIAPEKIRKKYLGKDVRRYFKNGNRSPIKYENVPE